MNPLHLLKLEWRKFSPNGTFRVFVVLYVVAFFLALFLARSIGNSMTVNANGSTSHPLASLFDYPSNWQVVACIGYWINLFILGSLGVFMITMEFSNRTIRQNVIFGMTRPEVAVSKIIWAAALALGATLFFVILTLGSEIVSGAEFGLPPVATVICFFVQAFGYLLLGNLVGLVIRQTALAALGYLAYVMFLEWVCSSIFYFSVAKTRLLLFLPNHVLGALTPWPDSIDDTIKSSSLTQPLSLTEASLTALVYLVLFAAFFCRRIVKADL